MTSFSTSDRVGWREIVTRESGGMFGTVVFRHRSYAGPIEDERWETEFSTTVPEAMATHARIVREVKDYYASISEF